MRLRDATADDIQAMWAIESAVFAHDAWSLAALRSEVEGEHRRYLVLVDDDGVVRGYAGVLVVAGDGDIQTIAVDPGARGRGQGRRLMEELLAEAARRGARQVFLEVRADNPVARTLYESLGFEEIGVRPGYYQPDDVAAVVMRRREPTTQPTLNEES